MFYIKQENRSFEYVEQILRKPPTQPRQTPKDQQQNLVCLWLTFTATILLAICCPDARLVPDKGTGSKRRYCKNEISITKTCDIWLTSDFRGTVCSNWPHSDNCSFIIITQLQFKRRPFEFKGDCDVYLFF